ncbi:hypothetical protein B9Z55_025617 [Caenorhabditis nigoni]|uniref:Uncharacterized protein n=1 Tax=Caenorhabditis nigoni TaxID=1611254 RepID=A0A2G5SZ62_9PELO|nr:hypothetical protein B9Z55_025617 [Caenorhabditis nigoni]
METSGQSTSRQANSAALSRFTKTSCKTFQDEFEALKDKNDNILCTRYPPQTLEMLLKKPDMKKVVHMYRKQMFDEQCRKAGKDPKDCGPPPVENTPAVKALCKKTNDFDFASLSSYAAEIVSIENLLTELLEKMEHNEKDHELSKTNAQEIIKINSEWEKLMVRRRDLIQAAIDEAHRECDEILAGIPTELPDSTNNSDQFYINQALELKRTAFNAHADELIEMRMKLVESYPDTEGEGANKPMHDATIKLRKISSGEAPFSKMIKALDFYQPIVAKKKLDADTKLTQEAGNRLMEDVASLCSNEIDYHEHLRELARRVCEMHFFKQIEVQKVHAFLDQTRKKNDMLIKCSDHLELLEKQLEKFIYEFEDNKKSDFDEVLEVEKDEEMIEHELRRQEMIRTHRICFAQPFLQPMAYYKHGRQFI